MCIKSVNIFTQKYFMIFKMCLKNCQKVFEFSSSSVWFIVNSVWTMTIWHSFLFFSLSSTNIPIFRVFFVIYYFRNFQYEKTLVQNLLHNKHTGITINSHINNSNYISNVVQIHLWFFNLLPFFSGNVSNIWHSIFIKNKRCKYYSFQNILG